MLAKIQRLIEQETSLHVPAMRLTPRANLYDLGLTAFDAVRLLVAIERAFKIKFPCEMLKRQSATSIEAIVKALCAVQPSLVTFKEMRAAA
jgi:acyl carrier protein